MNMMTELLGIDSEYTWIRAAAWLPIPTQTSGSIPAAQQRPGGSPSWPACTTHTSETEKLYMWFSGTGPLGGWNAGEGGCRVDTKFYPAFVGSIIGEDDSTTTPPLTAEHHALDQLMGGSNLQKWRRPSGAACGETAPVPGWTP